MASNEESPSAGEARREPFVKVPVAVLEDCAKDEITPTQFFVYAALRNFLNRGNGMCYPSWSTLLTTTGIARSTLTKALEALVCSFNLVRVKPKRGSVNYYFPGAADALFVPMPVSLLKAVKMKSVSPAALVVYAALLRFADPKSLRAWPDYDDLKQATGFCETTISNGLKNLLATDWIRRRKRFGASPIYTVATSSPEIELHSSTNRTSVPHQSNPNQNQGTRSKGSRKERKSPSTPPEVEGARLADETRVTPPGRDEVWLYGRERKYPEETVTKFWMLNQENGWTTSCGNPIRRWRAALDAFAETDRARLDPQLPGDAIKRFWVFVQNHEFGEYDGEYLANTWIRFMAKCGWKIPDPLTGTPVPVRDHIKTFLAWYENLVLDEDRQRIKWGDIDEDELYSGVATGAGGEEDDVF